MSAVPAVLARFLRGLPLVLALAGTGCGVGLDPEYQVYRAFLVSPQAGEGRLLLYEKLGIFFIYNLDQENADEIASFFASRTRKTLDPELVRNFVERNHAPRRVEKALLPSDLRYETVLTMRNVCSVSRVGFSPRGDEALLYATFSSMSEFGHGSLIHFERRFGRWRVREAVAVWVYG